MTWPFKKRGNIIDLTYLAKRGLIKPNEEFKDILPHQEEKSQPDPSSSAFGFLGAIASNAEPSEKSERPREISNNKIEDIEYKLETISKRVNAMIDRLDLVEKKLSRDLRRGEG